jgi:hypothetical protein
MFLYIDKLISDRSEKRRARALDKTLAYLFITHPGEYYAQKLAEAESVLPGLVFQLKHILLAQLGGADPKNFLQFSINPNLFSYDTLQHPLVLLKEALEDISTDVKDYSALIKNISDFINITRNPEQGRLDIALWEACAKPDQELSNVQAALDKGGNPNSCLYPEPLLLVVLESSNDGLVRLLLRKSNIGLHNLSNDSALQSRLDYQFQRNRRHFAAILIINGIIPYLYKPTLDSILSTPSLVDPITESFENVMTRYSSTNPTSNPCVLKVSIKQGEQIGKPLRDWHAAVSEYSKQNGDMYEKILGRLSRLIEPSALQAGLILE